jgi:multidrug resistance efflux pump
MARADRAQLVISQAKADEARAQLALVDEQLGRIRIEAPFDGVVIRGDLSQSLGAGAAGRRAADRGAAGALPRDRRGG